MSQDVRNDVGGRFLGLYVIEARACHALRRTVAIGVVLMTGCLGAAAYAGPATLFGAFWLVVATLNLVATRRNHRAYRFARHERDWVVSILAYLDATAVQRCRRSRQARPTSRPRGDK